MNIIPVGAFRLFHIQALRKVYKYNVFDLFHMVWPNDDKDVDKSNRSKNAQFENPTFCVGRVPIFLNAASTLPFAAKLRANVDPLRDDW